MSERKVTEKVAINAVIAAALAYDKVNPLREEWVEVDDNLRKAIKELKRIQRQP